MSEGKKTEVELFYKGFSTVSSCVARDAHTRLPFGEEETLSHQDIIELADRNLSDREQELEAMRILQDRFLKKWNAVLYQPQIPKATIWRVEFINLKTNAPRVVFVKAIDIQDAVATATKRINAPGKYRFGYARQEIES